MPAVRDWSFIVCQGGHHSFYPPLFKGGGEQILGNFQKGGLAEGQKKGGVGKKGGVTKKRGG